MILLIILFLVVRCGNFPTIETQEVTAINYESGYCRSAYFDFSYGKLKSVSTPVNNDIDYSHKKICLSPQGWEAIINYLNKVYAWKDKNFKYDTKKIKKFTDGTRKDILELVDFQ
jgi:hypothetical protein